MRETFLRKFTTDKIITSYEKIGCKLFAAKRRKLLNNIDFSIISNNCWGGHVYRHFGLPYNSPTIGMYFFADEYIKLLRNFHDNIRLPLTFINSFESKYKSELMKKKQLLVPIGVLGTDIEIVFLHYRSKEDAYEKWMRRLERINLDNLIVKFSEMNLCNMEHLIEFDNMKFKKKLLLVSKKYSYLSNYKIVTHYSESDEVINDTTYYFSFINLVDLINKDLL